MKSNWITCEEIEKNNAKQKFAESNFFTKTGEYPNNYFVRKMNEKTTLLPKLGSDYAVYLYEKDRGYKWHDYKTYKTS